DLHVVDPPVVVAGLTLVPGEKSAFASLEGAHHFVPGAEDHTLEAVGRGPDLVQIDGPVLPARVAVLELLPNGRRLHFTVLHGGCAGLSVLLEDAGRVTRIGHFR